VKLMIRTFSVFRSSRRASRSLRSMRRKLALALGVAQCATEKILS
jgi:hypothetical protein